MAASTRETPVTKAARTALWATTMTKWSIRHLSGGKRVGARSAAPAKRWQFIGFAGPNGAESRGIVDLVAIRRDHGRVAAPFKPGDLFEIYFLQIKGGSARWPKADDLPRLLAVKDRYGAKEVLLAEWHKGAEPVFYALKSASARRDEAWVRVDAESLFAK